MTLTVTHRAPRQIVAGDSIEFLVAIPSPDYQSWTGSARITGPEQLSATTCATEGSDFHVYFAGNAGATNTGQLPAGQYRLTVWASDGAGRRITVAQFPITITADLSTGTPDEPHCVVMLRMIEQAIQARIGGNPDGGLEGYLLEGTSATKTPIERLELMRNKYSAEVAALQNPNGQIGRIKFTMTPAGGIADLRRRFG